MGDPKVQRSGDGFFTRFGRAVDAFGKDDTRSGKSAAKEAKAVELKPLPGKYKSSPRRLDRSVMSRQDAVDKINHQNYVANKIWEKETYVANALKLVDDMRALAVKEDSWHNRTTPKDVDKVVNKYKPLLLSASGATSYEKSEVRRQLSEMMVKELFETPTGENLFWDLSERHGDVFKCHSFSRSEYTERDGDGWTHCSSVSGKTCTVVGVEKSNAWAMCSFKPYFEGRW